MRSNWTAGSGDGVLVVMYDASPTPGDPVDGTVYTASTDFSSPGDPIANGYVVYSGPANSVFINGLTGNTTYYVKVYEYSGSGSGINYQQTGPLQGSQPTSAAPVGHNDAHDITNCDTCHAMHGTFSGVPRGTDQETVCKSCHNATEMPGLPEKYLVGMHEVTKGGPKTIDCGSCHEVHNGYDFNTVDTHIDGVTAPNLSRIRQDTNKYSIEDGTWGPALQPAIFQTDPDHFAFGETTGSQSGSPWNGICQTCHTNASMKWHTNAGQASEANPHDHNKGASPDNPDCMACHSHSEGFPTPTCQSCHSGPQDNGDGSPSDGRRAVWGEFAQTSHHTVNAIAETGDDCLVCHDQTTHMDGKVDLKNADTGALIVESASGRFRKANLIETDINNLNTFCQSCHDSDGAQNEASPSDPFGDGSTGPPEMSLHSNVDFVDDRVEPEFQVGCIQCHEGHGSTNLKIIDDTSVLIDNSVGLSSPGTTSGPVVFTGTTGTDSYDESDTENTDDADDICATCHINTMTNHTGGDHTASTQGTDERGNDCTSCHPHESSITTRKGFMPPPGGAATCDTCHAAGGTGVGGANNFRAIFGTGGDFERVSHHATTGPGTAEVVTENDCRVCHQEPDSNHQDGTIHLRHPDTGVSVPITTFDELTIQNSICLPCHDLDGAKATWNQTEGTSAIRPFSSDSGQDVPNAFDQFDTTNNVYHPVRGGTGTPSLGISAATMEAPWDTNLGTQTMTCFDCHDTNAHGSDYQKMIPVEDPASPGSYYGIDFKWYEDYDPLNDLHGEKGLPTPADNPPASLETYPLRIEVLCTKCHKDSVYVSGTGVGLSAFEKHPSDQGNHAAANGNELACLGCHGGFIDQSGGVVADNGAWNGNIHGVTWDWETDGGLTFGDKAWPGTPPADSQVNNFLVGGWLSGWSAAGECGGGNCNHTGSPTKGGGQNYTPAVD
jgi:hypothetical protein